jgi:hypothetical protein
MRNRKHGGTVTTEMSVIRNDEDIDIEVSGYFNPEQNGGMTDPSWSAYVEFEEAQDANGNPFTLTPDEIADAEYRLLEAA